MYGGTKTNQHNLKNKNINLFRLKIVEITFEQTLMFETLIDED